MSKLSMRGKSLKAGKGTGRKAGNGSTVVRVPNECLVAVQELIAAYRSGTALESVTETSPTPEPAILESVTETSPTPEPAILESVTETSPPLPAGAKMLTRKIYDRLTKGEKELLLNQFGTSIAAINSGLIAVDRKGLFRLSSHPLHLARPRSP